MTRRAAGRLRALLAAGHLDLPLPGRGYTPERLRRLAALSAVEDLSTARLAEAHCDAVAIAAEAGVHLPDGALAGVWASRFGSGGVQARRAAGGWRLCGRLEFCSGIGVVDVALIDAADVSGGAEQRRLFVVPLNGSGVHGDVSRWTTGALAETRTGSVEIDVPVGADAEIGPPDFYLRRPGFWHGAIGVAACWAGGAIGIVGSTAANASANPHAAAALGRCAACRWALEAILQRAGADIDDQPEDVGMIEALTVRQLVVDLCATVLAESERATGPGPLAFTGEHAQRMADLRLYIQQHHHGTDAAVIGRHVSSRAVS